MAKQKNPRRVGDKEARAKLRMIRISPIKLNLVAQLIRGKKVETALADLEFSHKRISGEVKKVLESAIANAENNHGLDIDSLIVSEAYVGKNFVMKRFRARARGRGARILKPFSELTIVVREQDEDVAPAPEKTEKKSEKKAEKKDAPKKAEKKKEKAA
ncbi:Large ribosomal subunit protein uL22 [Litorimonas haliclonae]